ncbi:hypothetical protein BDK51DRAFT_30752, partial [Blyttiomyces helicus]
LPSLRPELVAEELYGLKDENLALKKKMNAQEDKAKKLITKVQRLQEDLRRAKEPVGAGAVPARASANPAQRRETAEAHSMIDSLRDQMQGLTKENAQLRNKMNYFRSLHEAETRKRMPYDYVPPRVNTVGGVGDILAQMGISTSKRRRLTSSSATRPSEPVDHSEELEKLQELAAMLHRKLADTETELEESREAHRRLEESHRSLKAQTDIDILALQRDLASQKTQTDEWRTHHDTLDARFRGLTETHAETLALTETLNADLKSQRRLSDTLEAALESARTDAAASTELNTIIDDLRAEKAILEEEQARLLDAQFGAQRDAENAAQIARLTARVRELERAVADGLDEAAGLHARLAEAREEHRALVELKKRDDAELFEVRHQLDEMRERMRFFMTNGEIDMSEIEEALTMMRIKRERGITLDFLLQADELYEPWSGLMNGRRSVHGPAGRGQVIGEREPYANKPPQRRARPRRVKLSDVPQPSPVLLKANDTSQSPHKKHIPAPAHVHPV